MEKAPTQDLLHRCFFMTFLLLHRGGGGVELLDESAELGRVLASAVDDGLGALAIKP